MTKIIEAGYNTFVDFVWFNGNSIGCPATDAADARDYAIMATLGDPNNSMTMAFKAFQGLTAEEVQALA